MPIKKNYIQHGKPKRNSAQGQEFWNKEYGGSRGGLGSSVRNAAEEGYLALSTEPSEDLVKFTRWIERQSGRAYLNPLASVLDLGCGNGRNLLFMNGEFNMRGVGYDISKEAVAQATFLSKDLPLSYAVRSIAGPLGVADNSQTIVLDMMVSHFLKAADRKMLVKEIYRVLKPRGWLFFKTFLRDDDLHAERLLRDHPADEEGSYIHPEIGVMEHVFTEEEVTELLESDGLFTINKITKSHRHKEGAGSKRRSMSIYAQKNS